MAEITIDTHTHSKRNQRRSRKEMQTALSNKLDHNSSVFYAIHRARACYEQTDNAAHDVIQQAEDWINSSVNASKADIEAALHLGQLKRSCSSQRLFIQLLHRS